MFLTTFIANPFLLRWANVSRTFKVPKKNVVRGGVEPPDSEETRFTVWPAPNYGLTHSLNIRA